MRGNNSLRQSGPILKSKFFLKMIVIMSSFIVAILIFLGIYLDNFYSNTIEEQIGKRALSVAQSVALIPELKNAFFSEDPSGIIQPIAEAIRKETGAEFIVVGNTESIRYSHPIKSRIGKKMVGDDNNPALVDGQAYNSIAVGSLGPSMRGKVPVFSNDGEIIGIVSVGFLLDDINLTIDTYLKNTWYLLAIMILIGIIGAIFISYHVKKAIFGLEPEEIAHLFNEKEALIQSLHEGVIAVNKAGEITTINQNAQKILLLDTTKEVVNGTPIKDVFKHTKLLDVIETGQSQFNQELWINDNLFVVNRVPIYKNNIVIGAVATFRNKTEIIELSKELSKVKQYSEALRSQTHEFSNKLYTISGLLQLKKTKEAIEFINKESQLHQEFIRFLIERISDPLISAVLLGKMNRANELGVTLIMDEESSLYYKPTEQQRESLITIIGNLLDNAFDAVAKNKENQKQVKVSFTDIGPEMIFEVEDNGLGIDDNAINKIFTEGYSTKGQPHLGIGLHLVNELIETLEGSILFEDSELGGTCFIVTIPKK